MANVINGTSTGSGGLISSGDDSGILNIQTNETTAITVDASQAVTIQGLTVGRGAGAVATNTAVGASALAANQAGGTNNTAIGNAALDANTTGDANTAVGDDALGANTTASNNTAVGYQAMYDNTTGAANVAVGYASLANNTTAQKNVAVGVEAMETNTTGQFNTAVGGQALRLGTTASNNTAVGFGSGYSVTTGQGNTFIGSQGSTGSYGSGYYITTGSNNTIIGAYTGNNGGLDIRTLNNNIVLSDGDGNPRMYYIGTDNSWKSIEIYNTTTGSGANMTVLSSGTIARSTSALKYKQDIRDLEELDIGLLRPVRYKSKCTGDDQTKDHFGVIADEAADAGFEELISRGATGEVEGFQYERLTVVLLKAIQEQQAIIETLTQRITALEGA